MALQKLPEDIQSLFCASQLCSYKRAIEELIYNALDANSTSIAIRVNIEENSMQLIDNGCGISKNDFSLLGLKHATSKCVDLATLKSAPNKYGFRGLSLASMIENSKSVKISSRFENSEDTWVKSFYKGKEQKVSEASPRPSKGTTVDIKGFLYNLKIQKKAIEPLNELNDIKNFLEQLSLVHNNISVSLRDDAKNEIIFKLHKNRDIYQTLSSVFEINKTDIQEIKVEKGEYKVVAYIGRRDIDNSHKRWIYLNKKMLQNSKVNKIMNDTLTKTLKLNLQNKKNVKSKNPYNQEEDLSKSGIPFYFVFVTCPYYDYDLIITSKQTVVEFKHWDQIKKLLDKLVKFYAGDLKVQENKPVKNTIKNIGKVEDTRDEVKKIMERILGSNRRKIAVSQMQKGIKGKITKRKPKKQTPKLSLAKVIPNDKITHNKMDQNNLEQNEKTNFQENYEQKRENKAKQIKNKSKQTKQKISNKGKVVENKNRVYTHTKQENIIEIKPTKKKVKQTIAQNKVDNRDLCTKTNHNIKQKLKKSVKHKVDSILKKFQDDPSGSVRKRCQNLSEKIAQIMNCKKKRKREVFINETVQYSNVVKHNKKYSVRKKIGEIFIRDYIPKPIGISPSSYDGRIWDKNEKSCRQAKDKLSTYDLIRTVLRTQETKNTYSKTIDSDNEPPFNSPKYEIDPRNLVSNKKKHRVETPVVTLTMPKLTYESHNYEEYINRISHEYDFVSHDHAKDYKFREKYANNTRFITTQSKDNFLIPPLKNNMRRKKNKSSHFMNFGFHKDNCRNFNKSMSCTSSYPIEFTKTSEDVTYYNVDNLNKKSMTEPLITETYTIEQEPKHFEYDKSLRVGCTYTIIDDSLENATHINKSNVLPGIYKSDDREFVNHTSYTHDFSNEGSIQRDYITNSRETCEMRNMNVIFVSKSQELESFNENHLSLDTGIIPLQVCETVHSCENNQEPNNITKINDSLFNDDLELDSFLCDRNAYTQQNFPDLIDLDDLVLEDPLNQIAEAENILNVVNLEDLEECNNNVKEKFPEKDITKADENIESHNDCHAETESRFNFKDRLRFVPKGMSQIFQNCQTKNSYNIAVEEDYFEKALYNKFADDISKNAKIYEPEVQNVKELATKAVDKVKNKISKDNASLIFDGDDLMNVKVLAQIDNKFIATKISGRTHRSCEAAEYLILFDQHAVHERIRLENNLSDYLYNNQWKTTALDEFILKLSKDEILYLYNYKDKFIQLGLDWTMLHNGEVSIKAIPEAILGKNPRQVEIVMKAVKNLIIEEIHAIKAQGGCNSLYPKAIMELVFSEACRYAIKFGDKLSVSDCTDLLKSLAKCKTPFQCAHGRPVMAVLMEVQSEPKKFQVNIANITKWVKSKKLMN